MNRNIILEAKNISKFYEDGQVKAVNDLSLQVFSGETLLIRGPSGCGKSTLLHLLGGLDVPSSGTVLFQGQPVQAASRKRGFRLKNFGFIFQTFYLWPNLNVLENVLLPLVELPLSKKERFSKARGIIAEMGLTDKIHASVKVLSVGQRQRVAVARALVTNPSVILADEPTGSLDSKNRENVLQLLRRVNKERNITIVMVTHEDMSREYFDRQIQLLDGKTCN